MHCELIIDFSVYKKTLNKLNNMLDMYVIYLFQILLHSSVISFNMVYNNKTTKIKKKSFLSCFPEIFKVSKHSELSRVCCNPEIIFISIKISNTILLLL